MSSTLLSNRGANVSPLLEIWLLGAWQAKLNGEWLPPLPTRHTRALLARLAIIHPQLISRPELINDLFPGVTPSSAYHRLRTTIYYLRRVITDSLVSVDDQLGLNPAIRVIHDAGRFEAASIPGASLESLEIAMRLYRGPFLENPPDGWALAEAQRLHDRYLDTLRKLVILAQTGVDPARGLEAARRWQEEEPWEENAQLALVRALIACGDYQAAEMQLNRALSLLRSDIYSQPNPAFQSLAREISRLATNEPRSPKATVAPDAARRQPPLPNFDHGGSLVGRQAELAALNRAWSEASRGITRAFIIEGAAGIGKSWLVEELVSRIRFRSDCLVLHGVANERTPDLNLGLFREAFHNFSREAEDLVRGAIADLDDLTWTAVCRFLPEASALMPGRPPGKLVTMEASSGATLRTQALATFINRLCRQKPVVILLENSHYADEETRALLHELLQNDRPLLLLLTQHPTVAGKTAPLSQELATETENFSILRLAALDPQEVDELIRRILGDKINRRLLEQLLTVSGGVPLFVNEILRALFDRGDLAWSEDAGWSLRQEAITLPAPMSNLLKERLGALSASAQKLAEFLAVFGRPVESVVLDRLWPDKDARLAAQAELIRKQVAVETHNRLWLAHDWLGDKIRASMDRSKRVSYHAQIAAALRTLANCDRAERAYHQAQAGEWARALEDALAAGEQDLVEGRPTALSGMIELAEQVAEKMSLANNDPRRWPYLALREGFYSSIERGPAWIRELESMEQLARESDRPDWLLETLIRRGRAYRDLGRPDEAEKTLRQAAELAQSILSPGEAMARGLLAAVLDDRGATAEALLEAERASRLANDGADDIARIRTAANLAYMQMRSGKVEEARRLMSNLLADPAVHKQPVLAARAMRQLGIIQVAARDYESGLDNLRQSVTQARSTGDLHTSLICQTSLVYELARFGLFVEAYPLGETTLELARGLQAKTQIGTLLNSLTSISFYRGDLDQAWSKAQASVAAAERTGLPEYVASCLGMLAAVALRRQRLSLARGAIKRAEELLARVEHPTILTISHIAAQVWLESGEHQLAARAAHQAIDQVVDVGIPAVETIGVLWEAAQVMATVEGRPAAQPVYARAYQRLLDDMDCMQSIDLRRAFLNAFPAHRALLAFPYSGPRRLVELPRLGAPTGRPLHSDELAPVVWTLHAPGDFALETTAGRRQRLERLCVEAAEQGAKAAVDKLAQVLSVSPRTIQRDLQSLRRSGIRVETYGERSDQS